MRNKRLLRVFLLALLALFILFFGWRWLVARPAVDTGLQFPQPSAGEFRRPLVIAHADDSGLGLYPGNTAVFLRQMAAMPVDVLEMDVHLSVDGALVLMHDDTVDRTTDGSGAIREMTLAQLRRLNVAYHWSRDGITYPYREAPQRILTIDQVFAEFPSFPMIIELKTPQSAAAVALCEKLTAAGKRQQVIVSSFHQAALVAFRKACPQVATGAGAQEVRWFVFASKLGAVSLLSPAYQALHIPQAYENITLLNSSVVAQAQDHGLRVDVWTVNDEQEMRDLVAMGVDGIMTDRPDVLFKLLKQRISQEKK